MITIYVLKCVNNKYYVGKTFNDHIKRFNIHKKGKGAIWTKKYLPIEIINFYKNCDRFDEDKYTKTYMDKYGIDNVRGGSYTQVKLNSNTIHFLKKELLSTQDKCYGCGGNDHFYKGCSNKNKYDSCNDT
jgi:predicted GIY-YIG superfamily endonuclease